MDTTSSSVNKVWIGWSPFFQDGEVTVQEWMLEGAPTKEEAAELAYAKLTEDPQYLKEWGHESKERHVKRLALILEEHVDHPS